MISCDSLRCKSVYMFKIVTNDTTPTSILLVVTVIVEVTFSHVVARLCSVSHVV